MSDQSVKKQPTALIMAGGTGGHIFPGIALAEVLKEKGWRVEWMGTADRMEADLVPKHGLPIHFIDVKGVRGNGIKRLFSTPAMLFKAVKQAKNILKDLQPDVVVGFGGYASGPGGVAAKLSGIPLILHEQNAVMGLTNKLLSRVAIKTLLAFPNTSGVKHSDKVEVVGNPVRADIAELNGRPKRILNEHSVKQILIVGGSLGARVFNQTLPKIFSELKNADQQFTVRHQCGKNNQADVEAAYHLAGFDNNQVTVAEFIDDMAEAFSWADIIICRAGALTVSEVAASGNAAIFVPLPHAVDDHQTANANWLVAAGAAKSVPQSELEQSLPALLKELFHAPNDIAVMQQKAGVIANLDTTKRMLSLCQAIGIKH